MRHWAASSTGYSFSEKNVESVALARAAETIISHARYEGRLFISRPRDGAPTTRTHPAAAYEKPLPRPASLWYPSGTDASIADARPGPPSSYRPPLFPTN